MECVLLYQAKQRLMNCSGKATEIKPSRFGKGLFAAKNIASNTCLCSIQGKNLSFKETLLLGDKESHCLQIAIDRYILCESPFLYSNHSCNPNCAINNYEFFSLKEIKTGEELFWDYSTSMLERHWTMNCSCGNQNCRKIITDFDLLPIALQEKYIKMNIVLPFLLDQLQFKIAI
jgi:hypothetical protein